MYQCNEVIQTMRNFVFLCLFGKSLFKRKEDRKEMMVCLF